VQHRGDTVFEFSPNTDNLVLRNQSQHKDTVESRQYFRKFIFVKLSNSIPRWEILIESFPEMKMTTLNSDTLTMTHNNNKVKYKKKNLKANHWFLITMSKKWDWLTTTIYSVTHNFVRKSFIFLYYRRLKLATGFWTFSFYFLKKDGRQFSVATEISDWILD
jgi:hypothetical protein